LWALDYQWWWAAHGASGVNFHTGDKVAARDENKPCRYAVFWTAPRGYNIHPIGYALKMFSLGAKGSLIPTAIENIDNLDLAVYAAARDKNNITVTLINREHGFGRRAAEVRLTSGLSNIRAQVMFLTAMNEDVATKTGVTLGDSEIRDNAKWNGKWMQLTNSATDEFTLKLPASTAALVKISGR
jgi:hypothetical protein